ncbi:MAG TPA: hypothetical protein V6D22_08235 [Candidatus Obscuribacterales bacterium]
MRSDMYKVIVERPRAGGSRRRPDKGRLAQKLDHDVENCRHNESMKFRWRLNRKSLNENLKPLYRFIHSQIGRPWNDVFSEICEHISVNSTVQKHVRDHIDDFVCHHAVMVEGKPYSFGRYRKFGPVWEDFYVHPDTGILSLSPVQPPWRVVPPKPDFEQVRIDDLHKFVKIDALWYFVTFAPLPEKLPEVGMPPWDIVLRRWTVAHPKSASTDLAYRHWRVPPRSVPGRDFIIQWGAPIYAVSKRQANKREIRQQIVPKFARPVASHD